MNDATDKRIASTHRLDQVVEIVSAFVSRNVLPPDDLPRLITETHKVLRSLDIDQGQSFTALPDPAVPVKKSVTGDFIICLDDGKKFKSLKRHLTVLGMTPDEYRAKWGLPANYPMVAPNYAATRSALAKANGLGRVVPQPQAAPAKQPHKKRNLVE